jgi:Fe-S-cluster-containing dehydrogenase component
MSKNLKVINMNKCIGCFTCMNVCAAVNQKSHSLAKSAIKIRTSGGISGKFVSSVCLACQGERACALACQADALTPREGGGVILQEDKCIGCQKCRNACIVDAIQFDEISQKPIICKHCGVCAKFCPHNCLRTV